ncbi:GntR family transcriptional regulator [Wenjunlia tyrosinilytica]|uniref:GntR family transcriptional regulator n=1 Tax=Wenjunlia tyrosinilytica TaxID=1544741 RepID=A0A917ZNX6_9ACTN|nr:GntR family transcriptional regulator [Wenjunlia tyrosinilytica]
METRRPPFQRVAEELRQEILQGTLAVGDQLPTQEMLKERFHVSRSTVQRAIQELQDEGYLDSQRGRAAVVANRHPPSEDLHQPQAAVVSLVQHLESAFAAEHVRIDAFCLTTQTLHGAFERPLRRIYAGELRPKSITLRVLLPSPGAHLALPQRLSDPDDAKPLKRLNRLINNNAYLLRNKLLALGESQMVAHAPEVSVEIRSVPITPVQKLYVLNENDVLVGFYRVVERSIPENPEWGPVYDVLGLGSTLFWHAKNPDDDNDPSGIFVRESQAWFTSLWSTIAEELKLSE